MRVARIPPIASALIAPLAGKHVLVSSRLTSFPPYTHERDLSQSYGAPTHELRLGLTHPSGIASSTLLSVTRYFPVSLWCP